MDNQQMCESEFIDQKKAFDLVDHGCLLHKLEHYGLRGSSLYWFRDYLTTRSQNIQFKNDFSPCYDSILAYRKVPFLDHCFLYST